MPMKSSAPPRKSRDRVLEQRLRRDHDHGRSRAAALDLAQQVEAGAVGQIDVQQHRSGSPDGAPPASPLPRLGFDRLVIPAAQRLGKHPPNRRLVVYD